MAYIIETYKPINVGRAIFFFFYKACAWAGEAYIVRSLALENIYVHPRAAQYIYNTSSSQYQYAQYTCVYA